MSLGVTIGDLGYNLDIPPRGDDFIGGLSKGLGSQFPWMVAPGNHEADCNYTYANYLGRSLYSQPSELLDFQMSAMIRLHLGSRCIVKLPVVTWSCNIIVPGLQLKT